MSIATALDKYTQQSPSCWTPYFSLHTTFNPFHQQSFTTTINNRRLAGPLIFHCTMHTIPLIHFINKVLQHRLSVQYV
jgi:hypothetical protein